MISTHNAYLPTPPPQISLSALCVHILSSMKDNCIISIGKLWEDGFVVNFDTKNVFLQKRKHVLIGYRYANTGLYLIDFDNPPPSMVNLSDLALLAPSPRPSNICAYSVHEITKTRNLVLYPQRATLGPLPSTWIQAIESSFYGTWKGLTSALVCKHIPKIIYTFRGKHHQ